MQHYAAYTMILFVARHPECAYMCEVPAWTVEEARILLRQMCEHYAQMRCLLETRQVWGTPEIAQRRRLGKKEVIFND